MSMRFRKRRYRRSRKHYLPSFKVSREARNSIIVLLLFSIGIFTLLSVLGGAGQIGESLLKGISYAVGEKLVLLVTVVAWLTAFLMLNPGRFSLNAANYSGIVILILSTTSLFHLQTESTELLTEASLGKGGGMVGLALSIPLFEVGGVFVVGIAGILLFILSIVLIFNTSLTTLISGGAYLLYPFKVIVKAFFNLIKMSWGLLHFTKSGNEDTVVVNDDAEDFDEDDDDAEDFDEDDENTSPAFSFKRLRGSKRQHESLEQPALSKLAFKKQTMNIPLSLLESGKGKPTAGDIRANQQIIKNTLASFNIESEMGEVLVGPTVTQYTLKPSVGVKLAKISALHNDLALALAAHPIRIEAPIPGQSLVGIEVPNKSIAVVKLRDIFEESSILKSPNPLEIVLGRDVAGKVWIEDLASMPHLLIAGATGSGKSVCLNAIIVCLLYQNHPNDLKFILIDPKRVELTSYNKIPHLLTPVITDTRKVINALKWAMNEMERRYQLFEHAHKRKFSDYNADPNSTERLPYIIIVIDELADLMQVASSEVETAIIRISQKARAVGIHLIVATQSPRVDVITGLMKANIPARIAFAVASSTDSRIILDTGGADKLIGRGDMLYISAQLSKPKRIQGVFVNDDEIQKIADHLSVSFDEVEFDQEIIERQKGGVSHEESWGGSDEDEELILLAIEEIKSFQKASASLLQRRLRVGYARAARILDALEERGLVGPQDGSKSRDVLIPKETDDTMPE